MKAGRARTRRGLVGAIALAATVAGCGASSGASSGATSTTNGRSGSVAIRFHPAVGASWHMAMTMLNETEGGAFEVQMEFDQEARSIDTTGRRVVETRCAQIALRQPVQQALDCTPAVVEACDGSGRCEEIGVDEQTVGRVAGSTQNERPVFLAYPPHEVAIGDTWRDTVRWVQAESQNEFAVEATYSLVSITPEGDDLVAHVHMAGALTMSDTREVPPSERSSASGDVTGDFSLRVSDGLMEGMTLDMRFDIQLPAALGGARSPAHTRFVITTTPTNEPAGAR